MAFDPRESAEITAGTSGLCINTGTPHKTIIKSYTKSLKCAAKLKIPVALDFPGVGASRLRQNIARSLLSPLKNAPEDWSRIIRGNGSEIYSLAAGESRGGSIDSFHKPEDVSENCFGLLLHAQAVCISGPNNIIISGPKHTIPGGSPLMSRVTGFGCVSTALMAAFLSIKPFLSIDHFEFESARAVCVLMNETAHSLEGVDTPREFKNRFIDALYEKSEQACEGDSNDRYPVHH